MFTVTINPQIQFGKFFSMPICLKSLWMKAFPFSSIILEERKAFFVLLQQETHLKTNALSVGAVQYKAVVCQCRKLWHRVTFSSVNVSRIQDESVPGSLIFVRGCRGLTHRVASTSLPHLLYSSFLWRARDIFKSGGPGRFITSDMRTTQALFGVEEGVWGERRSGRLLEPHASDVTSAVTF